MPSFWDLLPAGAWPTEPFVLPGLNESTPLGWPPYATGSQGPQQQDAGIGDFPFGQSISSNGMELLGKPGNPARTAQNFWDLIPASGSQDRTALPPDYATPPAGPTLTGTYPWETLPLAPNDAGQIDRLATGREPLHVADMLYGKGDDSWATYRMRNLHRLMSLFGAPLPDYADERSKAISQGGGLAGGLLNSAWDAFTAPGDAMRGKFDPNSPEGIARVVNLGGWVVGGGVGAPRGTMASGMRRPPGPPRFRPVELGDLADVDLDALSARAREIHSVLDDFAQDHRATAVLRTNRKTIVARGRIDLKNKQLAMLRDEEYGVKMPGIHAEITALRRAIDFGFTPRAIATSRPMCDECIKFIESLGGRMVSPTTAIFPVRGPRA